MESQKILIVDDEESITDLLAKKLETQGYQTIQCARGEEAIEKANSFLPDLILMDILLPDMDGAEVVKVLQKSPATMHIPIIFLSGIITEEEGVPETITVGNRHYDAIGKPFNFSELSEMINRLI